MKLWIKGIPVWLDIFCTQMQMKELYLFWGRLFHITWHELSQSCHSCGLCKSWKAFFGNGGNNDFGLWLMRVLAGGSVLWICGCGSSTELVALLSQSWLRLPSGGCFLTLAPLSRPVLQGDSQNVFRIKLFCWNPCRTSTDHLMLTDWTRLC